MREPNAWQPESKSLLEREETRKAEIKGKKYKKKQKKSYNRSDKGVEQKAEIGSKKYKKEERKNEVREKMN